MLAGSQLRCNFPPFSHNRHGALSGYILAPLPEKYHSMETAVRSGTNLLRPMSMKSLMAEKKKGIPGGGNSICQE